MGWIPRWDIHDKGEKKKKKFLRDWKILIFTEIWILELINCSHSWQTKVLQFRSVGVLIDLHCSQIFFSCLTIQIF